MPIRNDHVPWSPEEYVRFATLSAQGASAADTAAALNAEFHRNAPVRTQASINNKRAKNNVHVGKKPTTPVPTISLPVTEQEVQQTQSHDGVEARSAGTRIKTVDDLLAHIEADLTRFEVEKSEATKYEVATKDPATGEVSTTELHRVFVRLRPKAGPSVIEIVQAIVDGASFKRSPLALPKKTKAHDEAIMQALVIADPHVGKYAWSRETGWEDYDIGIATRLLRQSAGELLEDGHARRAGRRVLLLLGDYFHYDTPHGQTTKGTPLDRDGRVEKMIEEGSRALFDIIEQSAAALRTEVVLVPGNHDALMTVALRQILSAYFRNDPRVSVDTRGTSRKYLTHGHVLLGVTHGDKAKKRLHELMAAEVPDLWGKSTCREIHTGHLHGEAAVDTLSGVTIRTHRALCPPDGWHALEGYVAKPRGMQAFYYHKTDGLLGMTVSNPDT